MLFRRLLLLSLLLPFAGLLRAQRVLSGFVKSADQDLALAFASIAIENSSRGTVANEDGEFSLSAGRDDAYLLVSYMGYEGMRIAIDSFTNGSVISMERLDIQLHEVEIGTDKAYLYDIMVKVRRSLNSTNKLESRAYLKVQTNNQGNAVELRECYYNATSSEHGMEELRLKNGRYGRVANDTNQGFVSLSSSLLFVYPDLIYKFDYLPDMPFHMGKKEMQRKLDLSHLSSIGDSLIQIAFTSRKHEGGEFDGIVWINTRRYVVDQIKLNCNNAAVFPFVPISRFDELKDIEMAYTFNFHWSKGVNYLKSITSNCDFTYVNRGHPTLSRPVQINHYTIKGLLYLYDFDHLFELPLCTYEGSSNDLDQISILGLNGDFWKFHHGLILTGSEKKDLDYLSEFGSTFNYRSQDDKRTRSDSNTMFSVSYVVWRKGKRVNLVEAMKDNVDKDKVGMAGTSSMYDIVVRLFLDMNEVGDSIQYFTATVFDAKETYYLYDKEPGITNAFMNMYFDICEIERRKLVEALQSGALTFDRIRTLYYTALERMEAQTKKYLLEVERGRNLAGMKKWNAYILEELGIDNLELFGLEQGPPVRGRSPAE